MVEEERYRIDILTLIDHVNHLPPRQNVIESPNRGRASRQRRPARITHVYTPWWRGQRLSTKAHAATPNPQQELRQCRLRRRPGHRSKESCISASWDALARMHQVPLAGRTRNPRTPRSGRGFGAAEAGTCRRLTWPPDAISVTALRHLFAALRRCGSFLSAADGTGRPDRDGTPGRRRHCSSPVTFAATSKR